MSILLGLGLVLAIIAITYVGVEVLGLTTFSASYCRMWQ